MNSEQTLAISLEQKARQYHPEEQRLTPLRQLRDFIQNKKDQSQPINLNFICTHNSRRSHLAAIMAQLAAEYFRIRKLQTFSGGTEATAFHENSVHALRDLGLQLEKLEESENPRYKINFFSYQSVLFSKKYTDPPNPKSQFAAILVCSSADNNCPVVFGAEKRIYLPYEDPKIADGKPEQDLVYRQRALEIGTELFWVFSLID